MTFSISVYVYLIDELNVFVSNSGGVRINCSFLFIFTFIISIVATQAVKQRDILI